MKILKIRILNLNSLKGDFTIDFEQPPLCNSGIFSITGNTGAGKTTILDAITLGLFGRVPRLEDMKGEQKIVQMMSYGTYDCYAEVEFRAKGQEYRAKWSMNRAKKSGNFQPSKRELAQLPDGTVLFDKAKDVDNKISELLGGLDYRRFTRSVLLAQGEFEQFLRGSEDRSAILERITDTSKYSMISVATHERYKKEEKILGELKNQLQQYRLLSEEEKEALQHDLQSNQNIAEQIQLEIQDYERLLRTWQEIYQLKTDIETIALQKTEKEDFFKSKENQWAQLQRYEKALPLRGELEREQQTAKELARVGSDWQQLEKQLIKNKEKTAQLEAAKTNCAKELEQLNEQHQAALPVWKEAKEILQDFRANKSRYVEIEKEQNEQKGKLAEIEKEQQSNTALAEKLGKEIEAIDHYLQTNNAYAVLLQPDNEVIAAMEKLDEQGKELRSKQKNLDHQLIQEKEKWQKSDADWTKNKEDLQKLQAQQAALEAKFLLQCQQYNFAANDLQSAFPLLKNAIANAAKEEKELEELESQLKLRQEKLQLYLKEEEEIEPLEAELRYLDKEYLNEEDILDMINEQANELKNYLAEADKLIAHRDFSYQELKSKQGFSSHRATLKEGEECPLCFATEHPFRHRSDIDLDYSLQLAKKEYDQAIASKRELEKKVARLEDSRKEVASRKLSNYKNRVQVFELLQNHQKRGRQMMEEIHAIEQNLQQRTSGYPHLLDMLTEEQRLPDAILELENRIKELEKIEVEWGLLPQTQQNIQAEISRLQSQLLTLEKNNSDYQQAIAQCEKEQQATAAAIQTAITKSKEMLAAWQFKENTTLAAAANSLKQERNRYQEQKNKGSELQQKLAIESEKARSLQANRQERQRAIAGKESELETLKTTLLQLKNRQKELVGDADPELLQNESEQRLSKAQTALQQSNEQWVEAQTTYKLQEKQWQDLGKQQEQLQAEIAQLSASLLVEIARLGFEPQTDLATFRASLLSPEMASALEKEYQKLSQEIAQLQSTETQYLSRLEQLEQQPDILQTPKSVVEEQLQQHKEKLNQTHQNIGKLEGQIEEQARLQLQFASLQAQLKLQEKEFARWARLEEMIGSAEGKKFRAFAQNINLQRLIQLANRYLHQFMNGRYHLEKHSDESLELDIRDSLQANHQRPLHTLSGGETFLASLALALGLSDLASGQTKIESLFIDEGFGSLDNETLQVALNALKTLESQGKTIGIISHVEPLKNAIPTQIRVIKKGSGSSHLLYE